MFGLLLVDLRADSEEDGEDGEDDVDGGEDDGALLQRVAAEAGLGQDVDQVLHGEEESGLTFQPGVRASGSCIEDRLCFRKLAILRDNGPCGPFCLVLIGRPS